MRQSVLNRLVDQELLRQYADHLKLAVSDEQIKQEIVNMPAFQANGKFDNTIYQQMLRANGISANTYAQYVREGLRLEQLQSAVLNSAFFTPSQQQKLGELLFQKRSVRLATFPLDDVIASQTLTSEEISQYYEANKAAFSIPEAVKVQYVV